MKKLKVLIIVDDEKLSSVGSRLVAELVSALKFGASFFYAKSFESALNSPQAELIKMCHYDVICIVDEVASFTVYSVLDSVERANMKGYYFIVSSNSNIIDQLKKDGPHHAFLLNEDQKLSSFKC